MAINKKRSRAMKAVWKRKHADGTAKRKKPVQLPAPIVPKRMKVRVISHQDELKMDEYEVDTLGELFDILTGTYLGIVISEIVIQINSTLL